MQRKIEWQTLSFETALSTLRTNSTSGLSPKESKKRIQKYGRNVLKEEKKNKFLDFGISQIKNPLVVILLIAGIITFILGEYLDTIVIFIALLINIVVGAIQQRRAGKAFELLKAKQEKFSFVIRGGRKIEISSKNLVPGDILLLESGQSVGADARLIETHDLEINESLLSGEWQSVLKNEKKTIPRDKSITESVNMVWMGTIVSSGNGKAVVVSTGMRTVFGGIAKETQGDKESDTPVQKNIKKIALLLTAVILAIVVLIVIFGISKGKPITEMLFLAVAITVAAVPSGLPAAITVVLALGMETILKKGGLMRNLLGTETLGSTTVILTDKTGTITEAKMRVHAVAASTSLARIEAETDQEKGFMIWNTDEREVLSLAVMASDAFLEWGMASKSLYSDKNNKTDLSAQEGGENVKENDISDIAAERFSSGAATGMNSFVVRGRPMERAILLAGLEAGVLHDNLLKEHPQTDFLQFTSSRKFSVSVHKKIGKSPHRLVFIGAPEYMIERADYILGGDRNIRVSKAIRDTLKDFQKHRSAKGERMIAVLYKDVREGKIPKILKLNPEKYKDNNLIFGGFILFSDPIRKDAKVAVSEAQDAGIRIVMVTGDNPYTAQRVAEIVGIQQKNQSVVLGSALVKMSDQEIVDIFENTSVFARVAPEEKQRLVRILQKSGEVVAMTGDGINDAPALRTADIGIAIGSGTDVAKESSDLILLNNGLQTIIHTIRAGRKIIDNIKKIVAYLISTSFSEIFLIGGAVAIGGPIPLLPAQILWINIVSEGFMNFAFAFEPEEAGIMQRDPVKVGEGVFTKEVRLLIGLIALISGTLLIALYVILQYFEITEEKLRTIMFVAVAVGAIFYSFSLKNFRKPIWKIKIFSNKYLIFAFFASFAVLLGALTLPPLQKILSLEPFSTQIFFLILGLGIINILIIEFVKYLIFRE